MIMPKFSLILLLLLISPLAAPHRAPAQRARPVRDPFRPLVSAPRPGQVAMPRPAGKAGLRWQSLQIQGIALGSGQAAVALAANGHGVSYLLRPGDRLFNAVVARISLRGLWLRKLQPAGPRGTPRGKLMLLPMRK